MKSNRIGPALFLSVLFFLLVLPNAAQQNKDVKDFVGRYVYSSGFVGAHYELKADGTYAYESFSDCCDPVWRENGTYTVKDDVVTFKILKNTVNQYDLSDPKQMTEAMRKLYHYKGEDYTKEDIETEDAVRLVRWGERAYLIPPERLHLFAAAINLKIEPRSRIIDDNFLTVWFFLRSGDETKKVSGKPSLPKEVYDLMPAAPVSAVIVKMFEQDKKKIYIIDKGSRDDLKNGMCFVGKNVEPEYDNLLWVVSVEENSARLQSFPIFRGFDYKTGDALSTESTYKK